MPSSSVMRLASTFCAVSDREFSTPHSRMQVAEHQKADQRHGLRARRVPAMIVTDDGEQDARGLGHVVGLVWSCLICRSFLRGAPAG